MMWDDDGDFVRDYIGSLQPKKVRHPKPSPLQWVSYSLTASAAHRIWLFNLGLSEAERTDGD